MGKNCCHCWVCSPANLCQANQRHHSPRWQLWDKYEQWNVKLDQMDWWITAGGTSRSRFEFQSDFRSFCLEYACSPLGGFPPGAPVSSLSSKTCMSKSIGDSELPLGVCENEWRVGMCPAVCKDRLHQTPTMLLRIKEGKIVDDKMILGTSIWKYK